MKLIKRILKNFCILISVIFFVNVSMISVSQALEQSKAEELIKKISLEVNSIISTTRDEPVIIDELEFVFKKYADTNIMALTTLGPARRTASATQLEFFKDSFQIYFLNKYARRFRELKDGEISILSSRSIRSGVEVKTHVHLIDWAPLEVLWLVSDRSGEVKIFNIIIDGINLLSSERVEIGVMLENRNGDIDLLSSSLRGAN
jgi:phospholipid transport system substrate-binding protein